MKQTAIEWLYDQIEYHGKCIYEIIEQAKAMEKEQIINAYEYTTVGTSHYGEQYYNETFKSE